jgi:exodeoxyribonuclease VII large subunit
MQAPTPTRVFDVYEITREIRGVLEVTFDDIWVSGELSNFKKHSSGHIYFSLKDDRATLPAAFFKQWNRYLKFIPKDGDQVVVHGRIGVYEPRGAYQLLVDRIEPAGAGARKAQLEQLKARLGAEGLFDVDRKRPLPEFPACIGVATSANGAALRDILTVTRRRFPNVRILIAPCRVQGDGAGAEIAAAIERLSRSGLCDVMIVGRGGGAAEDLWAFNEEPVCRAIAASAVPVVSAVGHETDTTLADLVADLRAPTPSAAAELVVANQADLLRAVDERLARLGRLMTRRLGEEARRVETLRLRLRGPKAQLLERAQRTDELTVRMESAWRWIAAGRRRDLDNLELRLREQSPRKSLARRKQSVEQLRAALRSAAQLRQSALRGRFEREVARLEALSPLGVLSRGYAIAFTADGKVVRDAGALKVGEQIEVKVQTGRFQTKVEKTWI